MRKRRIGSGTRAAPRKAGWLRCMHAWLRYSFMLLIAASLVNAPVYANICAVPGKDGTANLSGVVNTYWSGSGDRSAGATSITLGASRGAPQTISAGDLLLVIQMQDTTFSTSNNSSYGGSGNGAGYSSINQVGRYEFVRALNNVGSGGGTLNLRGETGAGLVYSYASTTTSGRKRSYQVVRVPQFKNASISGTVSAVAWNGSTGGIVAIDVSGRLTFSGGTISAEGAGFRGGGARSLAGGSGSNTDYRTNSTVNNNGSKGEGIAGTPRYVNDAGVLLDNGAEGYSNGSHGRGAPGNAGGGGTDGHPSANDENTGGGGGSNRGSGGQGGHAWCSAGPPSCTQSGGRGGAAVNQTGVDRIVMGGGGGSGTSNNGTGSPGAGFASSGAAGGGIVFVRAGEIAGSGSINANGASGNSTVDNDGTGGGGAGGTVVVTSLRPVGGTAITVNARGGNGGSNNGTGVAHGPGGGGGGGLVLSSAGIGISATVSGGSAGTTQGGGSQGANYGATNGSSGQALTIAGSAIPGLSSGGECTPTITKSFGTSPVTPGGSSRLNITIVNNNPSTNMTAVAFSDSYPSGLLNTASPNTNRSCGSGTLTAPANGSSFTLASGTITAGGSCTYSVNTTVIGSGDKVNTIAAGNISWNYGTYSGMSLDAVSATISVAPPLTIVKSSQAYLDPVNGATNPKLIPGGYVAYTATVANPGSYTVTNNSIIVIDATPPNLSLFVGDVPGGSGPVLFQNGSPSSGLTYTFSGLGSTTDDVDFSNNGGATWTYTPVPNASLVDPNVTHMRIRPKGAMAAGSTFNLIFGYMID